MTLFSPIASLPYAALGDVPNMQTFGQALTTALDPLVCLTFASSGARDAVFTAPVIGNRCIRSDIGAAQIYDGTAWRTLYFGVYKTFAAAWTASTTNPTIGNGTLVARYNLLGQMCHYIGSITAGSTTNGGTGTHAISLPFAAASNGIKHQGAFSYDTVGSSNFNGNSIITAIGGSTMNFSLNSITSSLTGSLVTNSSPVAFSANTIINWDITYEVA